VTNLTRQVCFGLLLSLLLGLCLACDGRPKSTSDNGSDDAASPAEPHVAEIDLRRGAPELASGSLLGGNDSRSFVHLIEQLHDVAETDEVKGVFVRLGVANVGMARAEEIGRQLSVLREKKVPIVCHADHYGNATTMLAALGCDEIWLTPAGNVDTVGLAAQLIFSRALLEKLKIQVDFLQVGKYKGAQEMFTRDSPSPEARQSLQTALGGIRKAWIENIEKARSKDASSLGLEDGPHTSAAAKSNGLIDEIGFESQARARVYERAGVTGKIVYFGRHDSSEGGVAELVRLLSDGDTNPLPHVAVVRATGAITLSGGGGLLSSGEGISQRSLSADLRRLEMDETVKAVVVRITSPGGSALASDLLWRSLMDLRAVKPLVFSVGSMAASGGYYMACAGPKVIAERTSILGSIGVVGGKLSFAASLEELGIHVEAVPANEQAGARSLYGSPLAPWDDATRAKLLTSMQHTYDLFVSRIAEGRGLDATKVEPYAEGRIMGGDDALAAGLIDEVGGLRRAIALARELAGDEDLPVQVMSSGGGLLQLLGIDDNNARALAAERLERETAARARRWLTAGLLPFREEVEAFATSATPLLQGEHILTALPFALALR
jgi:protease-4